IVQDITAILAAIAIVALGAGGTTDGVGSALLGVGLKGVAFLVAIALVAKFLLPPLLHVLARSPELLVLSAIAWAVALAAVGDVLGFSQEVGAFLAGVAFASTPYRVTVAARLTSLRDFLLLFFFINLGAHVELQQLGAQLGPALALTIFVLLVKPLLVVALMGVMGYRKYAFTMTGISLSQIGEFSLILVSLGISLGHIDRTVLGVVTLTVLASMTLSTYGILSSHTIYPRLARWLQVFEREFAARQRETSHTERSVDAIVFGLGRYGGEVVENLRRDGLTVLGVDFDPEIVAAWSDRGIQTLYGDSDDPELAALLPLGQAKWVASTIPRVDSGLALLHTLRHYCFQGQVALTSHNPRDEAVLREAGADLVLMPFRDAAIEAARLLGAEQGAAIAEDEIKA
ncbi:MAG: cation:proton antiporter, partial [Cyanobacteria bacterium J06641_5]